MLKILDYEEIIFNAKIKANKTAIRYSTGSNSLILYIIN